MKWWLTLALAVPLAACPVADFSGDKQRIRFTSNLARPLMAWNPSTPVAVGTSLQFTAVDPTTQTDSDYGYSEIGGFYRETLTGLHRNPLATSGTFHLRRLANTPVLNQNQ